MSSCIARCIVKVVETNCHCIPLLPVDVTSQNNPQNHILPPCTVQHFINCEENEAETNKCLSEQCPINCDQDVFELVPATIFNNLLELPDRDVTYLRLIVQENYRYPNYAEVYTQTRQSFLAQLGELH